MEKITKKEYRYALKIVADYKQQEVNKRKQRKLDSFNFLWFSEKTNKYGNFIEVEHFKNIDAKNIDSACKKFLAKTPKTMTRIDDEAVRYDGHSSEYIDITNKKELAAWFR